MIFHDETFRAQQLESFQEVIPVAVLYCQPVVQNSRVADFRYIWGNRAALNMAALSPSEFSQMTMLQVFPSFVDMGVFNRYVQAWETGITQRFERQHPIGNTINWVDVTVSKKKTKGSSSRPLTLPRPNRPNWPWSNKPSYCKRLLNVCQPA